MELLPVVFLILAALSAYTKQPWSGTVGLVGVAILLRQKRVEGMTGEAPVINVDLEAVKNFNSFATDLYQNRRIPGDLKIDGSLTVDGDATIGPVYVGSLAGDSNWGTVSTKSRRSATNYGLAMFDGTENGHTYINATGDSGQVHARHDGETNHSKRTYLGGMVVLPAGDLRLAADGVIKWRSSGGDVRGHGNRGTINIQNQLDVGGRIIGHRCLQRQYKKNGRWDTGDNWTHEGC